MFEVEFRRFQEIQYITDKFILYLVFITYFLKNKIF